MSIFPKYQPIQFETYLPNECNAELYDFQPIAEQTDYATFQVTVAPCDGVENIILDPNFAVVELGPWTPSGGFSLITGDACKGNDSSVGAVTQVDVFVIGQAYQISVTVTSLTGSLQVYNGATLIYTIYNQGITTFSFVATDEDIALSFDNPLDYGCIDQVLALPFSANMSFGIIDENGDTAFVADFATNPEFFTFVENTVTIKFLWSDAGLTNGCYRIGFADGCTNTNAQFGVFNEGLLNGSLGWTEDEGTLQEINFNVAGEDTYVEFVGLGANETGSITNNVTQLTIGICYRITIADASTDGDGFLRFYCGTNFFDLDLTIGIYPVSFDITCAGTDDFKIEAHMETATNIKIGLGMTVRLCDPTDYVFDYMSQSFKLADDHLCTHLISLTCDENALNYVFVGSGFEPSVRLRSEIYNSAPEELRESYHDNVGTKKVTYGEYRKHFFFTIEMIPAWLLDFFYLGRIADHWYVDGTEYFMEGETPSPEWADGITNFATLRTEISEKTQLTRNANINTTICDDSDLEDLTCEQINSTDVGLTIEQRSNVQIVGVLRTGITASDGTGDDGNLEHGRGGSFLTLNCNNPFGNLNRHTATDGTQVLIGNLVVDWETGLMWYRVAAAGTDWDSARIAANASTQGGYTDWALPNLRELHSLYNFALTDALNYGLIMLSSSLWTGSTVASAPTTNAWFFGTAGDYGSASQAASIPYIICRRFTLADLGL